MRGLNAVSSNSNGFKARRTGAEKPYSNYSTVAELSIERKPWSKCRSEGKERVSPEKSAIMVELS